MPRGNRGIFFAVAGLILVGASQPPQHPAQPEQSEAQAKRTDASPNIATPTTEAPKPIQSPEQMQPCGQGRYASSDDLCAQWKAADAAADAAKWAWWQIILSALGVLGLGVTLWFNFRALRLAEREANETKGALEIAETNAQAAVRLADLSEKASIRQLRAYVFAKSASIEQGFPGDDESVNLVLTFNNSGQTPAYVRKISFGITWITEDGCATVFDADAPAIFRVHKDVPVVLPYPIKPDFEKSNLRGYLLIAGRIEYKDAFGKRYSEPFSWRTMEHDFIPFDEMVLPAKLAYFAIETVIKPSDRPRTGKKGAKKQNKR